MILDLSALEKATASLKRAVERSRNTPVDEELRDAVIQRFEYTYELSWKMIRRQLELLHPTPVEISQMAYKDLIRTAVEYGLIEDAERWFEYRRMRNITAHTYDEEKAREVHGVALGFQNDAEALLQELKKRNAAS